MLLIILIGVIIFVVLYLNSTSSYSDEKLLEISTNLKEKTVYIYDFPSTRINTKQKFDENWKIIIDNIYYYDRMRDSYTVNQWCYCAVKYYTRYVIKYGNKLQKKALTSFAKLMELNGFVNYY